MERDGSLSRLRFPLFYSKIVQGNDVRGGGGGVGGGSGVRRGGWLLKGRMGEVVMMILDDLTFN